MNDADQSLKDMHYTIQIKELQTLHVTTKDFRANIFTIGKYINLIESLKDGILSLKWRIKGSSRPRLEIFHENIV